MKGLNKTFLFLGLVFFIVGLVLHKFLFFLFGVISIVYSFFQKKMEPTRENIFKVKPFSKKKKK